MTTLVQDEMLETLAGGGGGSEYFVENYTNPILPVVTGLRSLAIGSRAVAGPGDDVIAIGERAIGAGRYNIAIGESAKVDEFGGLAIGSVSECRNTSGFDGLRSESTAIGPLSAKVYGTHGTAIGDSSRVGDFTTDIFGGIAIGNQAHANHPTSVVIGGVTSTEAGEVVLATALGRLDNALEDYSLGGNNPEPGVVKVRFNAQGEQVFGTTPREAADDAAAAALTPAVPVGGVYRTGSVLKVRVV